MSGKDYQKPDYYARKARAEGYAARSVFKLKHIDERHRLLGKGVKVLDLGASPGSWMQYAAAKAGKTGKVVGVDINPLARAFLENEAFILEDVLSIEPERLRKEFGEFDVVLSDLAPRTTGHGDTDHFRSMELAERALFIAEGVLRKDGDFLVKVFQGREFEGFIKRLRDRFARVRTIKPHGSRASSREMFALCQSLRKNDE